MTASQVSPPSPPRCSLTQTSVQSMLRHLRRVSAFLIIAHSLTLLLETSSQCNGWVCARVPGKVQAGTGLAGSSVRADSWWCSPGSGGPGRRAETPDPDWPGCLPCWSARCHGYPLHDFSDALHVHLSYPLERHDLSRWENYEFKS